MTQEAATTSKEKPPLYQSKRLTQLVIRWVNTRKIKLKNYLSKDQFYCKEYKKLLNTLTSEQFPFEFNNRSVSWVLDNHFNLS